MNTLKHIGHPIEYSVIPASPQDDEFTKRLIEAGDLLGIRVLDHMVCGDGQRLSFADEGWL